MPSQPTELPDDDAFWIKGEGGSGPRYGGGGGGNPLFTQGSFLGFGPGYSPGAFGGPSIFKRRTEAFLPLQQGAVSPRQSAVRKTQPPSGFAGAGGGGFGGAIRGRFGGGQGQQQQVGGGGGGGAQGANYLPDWFQQQAGGANGSDYALLGQAGLAGAFDPLGSAPLLDAIRQNMMGSAGAREQAARTRAMLDAGNDPSLQAAAGLQSRLGFQNDLSSTLQNALLSSRLQNMGAAQQFGYGLLGSERGVGQNIHQQRMFQDIQKANQPGWGDMLGGIAGIGIGSLLGGPFGGAMGGALFGGGGGRQ